VTFAFCGTDGLFLIDKGQDPNFGQSCPALRILATRTTDIRGAAW